MSERHVFPLPGSVIGPFYPTGCIVAVIASDDDAQAIAFELQKAGFLTKNCLILSGTEVMAHHQEFTKGRPIADHFEPKILNAEEEIEAAYVDAARDGSHLAIVRAGHVELQQRIRRILLEHGGSAMRLYHRTQIEDL